MDHKTLGWPRGLIGQQDHPLADESLAQEDADTRSMVRHYLHLAQRFLSAWAPEKQQDEDSKAA